MKEVVLILTLTTALLGCKNSNKTDGTLGMVEDDSSQFRLEVTKVKKTILLQEIEPATTFPYFANGMWRFVNKDAVPVIDETYKNCSFFSGGFAWVMKDSGYGVINLKGEYVVPCQYEGADIMQYGFLPLKKDGLWGFYDTTGKQVIPFLFESFVFCQDSTIHVRQNRQWGIIDFDGKQICAPLYDNDFTFVNHLAVVSRKNKKGVINTNGDIVLQCLYRDVSHVDDTTFIVEVYKDYHHDYFGVVTHSGREIIPVAYTSIVNIGQGALIAKHENSAGILDIQGDTLIDFMYRDLRWKNTNLIMACGENGCGYITIKNDTIIPFDFSHLEPFDGDMAVVKAGNKLGTINCKNKQVIPFGDYSSIKRISTNLFVAWLNEPYQEGAQYIFIDTSGHQINSMVFDNLQYHELQDYRGEYEHEMQFCAPENGFFIVGKMGRIGMMDLDGNVVVPLKYHYLEPMNEYGYTVATFWDKSALVNNKGEQLTGLLYDEIKRDNSSHYFYAGLKVPEKNNEHVRMKDVHAGYIGFDGHYYGSRLPGFKELPSIEEYILKIRKEYTSIQKEEKQTGHLQRTFADGLKGNLSQTGAKFVVTDDPKKMRYEYYYNDELNRHGPFFIFIVDKSIDKASENRYYYIQGKIIRWIGEDGKEQWVADAKFAPEDKNHHLARKHLAEFKNQEFLNNEEINRKVKKINEQCGQISSDITKGLYKKGDSNSEGMGEYYHSAETYLDRSNQLIFSNESQSYEEGGYHITEYYMGGELIRRESDNNYTEISDQDMKEGWLSRQYTVTSYFENGELIRSVTEKDGITEISD